MRVRGKIYYKKQQAIVALLERPTIIEACRAVGVAEGTMFRWLQDEDFQRSYRAAKHRVVDQAIARLQDASGQAVDVLRAIMVDEEKPAGARVTAARNILESALKAVEIENLEARIEAIERILEEKQ